MIGSRMAQEAAALWVYRKDWNGLILATTLPGALIGVGNMRRLGLGGAYFRRRGARADRRHHHLLRALLLDRPQARCPRERQAGRDRRRGGGGDVRRHLDALPGRRAAVSDVRAGAAAD